MKYRLLDVLFLLLILCALMFPYLAQSDMNHLVGRVYWDKNGNGDWEAGEPGLSGVGVTDGDTVVLTDVRGCFRFTSLHQQANWLSVSLPTDYDKCCRSFHLLTEDAPPESLFFPLRWSEIKESLPFRFIQTSDIHVWDRQQLAKFSGYVDHLNQLSSLAFVVATGDEVSAGDSLNQFTWYLAGIAGSRYPWLSVMGNHEKNTGQNACSNYQHFLGPDYYSFDYASWHLVVLNSTLSAQQPIFTHWLWQDLAKLASTKPILVFMHHQPEPWLLQRLHRFRVKAVFSGHWHASKNLEYAGIRSFNTPPFRFGGIDGSPAGYLEVTVFADSLSTHFQPHRRQTDSSQKAISVAEASKKSAVKLRLIWQTQLPVGVSHSRLGLANEQLLVATRDRDGVAGNKIYALDTHTGAVNWLYPTRTAVTGLTVSRSKIFLQEINGTLHSISAGGEQIWCVTLSDSVQPYLFSSPVVMGGRLIAGNLTNLICLNASSGRLIWQRSYAEPWSFVYADLAKVENQIWTGGIWRKVNLLAVSPANGDTAFTLPISGIMNQAVSFADGMVTVDYRGMIEVWQPPRRQPITQFAATENEWATSTPSVWQDTLFCPLNDGSVCALHLPDLRPLWSYSLDSSLVLVSPYRCQYQAVPMTPLPFAEYLLVSGSDGVVAVLRRANGELSARVDLGSPILTPPLLQREYLSVATLAGGVFWFKIADE